MFTTKKEGLLASRVEVNERFGRDSEDERPGAPPLRQNLSRSNQDIGEMVARAQVAAWRDAWRAGATFVTLELVARHVQRSIEWVQHHWNDDPHSLASSVSNRGDHRYQEPDPNPLHSHHYSTCGECCDCSDSL